MIKLIAFINSIKINCITIQLLFFFYILIGCSDTEKKNSRKFNNLKVEVKDNYSKEKKAFDELKKCFEFKFIKTIDFKANENVVIEFKLSDTSQWFKIEADINDKIITTLLTKENLTTKDLGEIKNNLNSLKSSFIWLFDNYSISKGFNFKEIEIKYNREVNGLHFYYKIYDRPLSLIDSAYYWFQISDKIGGVLDKDCIFYYK